LLAQFIRLFQLLVGLTHLLADWIVVGHSHFDHLWGAERIAKRTGATIIGSHETVRIMEKEGVPLAQLLPVGGGERIQLLPEVTVTVYPALHSCVWTMKAGMYQPDEVCLGDLWVTYQERMARMQGMVQEMLSLGPEALEHLRASRQGERGDGGSFVYLFATPHGSLLYQDTSGHWRSVPRTDLAESGYLSSYSLFDGLS
jgi:hypothetical protein